MMLTYDFSRKTGPLYEMLYEYIREDIMQGRLEADTKLPSKRNLAKNLGISTITVENAYDQLVSEGYIYALPKRGFFVSNFIKLPAMQKESPEGSRISIPDVNAGIDFNFSSNRTAEEDFPFSVWAKVVRETISFREREILEPSPCGGIYELRSAIAGHLTSFRGMRVHPNQVIVGAGTEYLYGLLVKLLGNDKIYCIENPGYKKLRQIYESNQAECRFAGLDDYGIKPDDINRINADIIHISPTHHFPTGITMPVKRRHELLTWAYEKEDRYIIEDDYDSEFRLNGKPIPTLQSIDKGGKVVYMNTFSKSISSAIRISYMVLPELLANRFYEELSFYSCTVSTFMQYALAAFIAKGYFEKHINRMRLFYSRKREKVLQEIEKALSGKNYHIVENDSGLHFILEIESKHSDTHIKEELLKHRIRITLVADCMMEPAALEKHRFIVNYSNMDIKKLPEALSKLSECI